MTIVVKKDRPGYLATVKGQPHIFAWGETASEAKSELLNVVDMLMDYHLEQIEIERKIKGRLTNTTKVKCPIPTATLHAA